MNSRSFPFFLLFVSLVSGCINSKEDESGILQIEDADLDYIYFDYKITAEEGDDKLTIMLQYRDGGEDGKSMFVEPGEVKLDGEKLVADSSGLTGAFYEIHKPMKNFAGKHSIDFSYGDKNFKEEFNFAPMILLSELPDTIGREEITLELGGLEQEDYVRLILFDTSQNDGINRFDTVFNGRIQIGPDEFDLMNNGEIQMELHREYDVPVKDGTSEGGRLYIYYVLKRRFILKD